MNTEEKTPGIFSALPAVLLLLLMAVLAGGAALRESVTVDEVSHIGAGVSYLQKLDLRMNPEHPPLPKMLAAEVEELLVRICLSFLNDAFATGNERRNQWR
jgi:hypothetical protein